MKRHCSRGSAILYTILLSPILMLSLALVVDVGAVQMQKERLRSAADMSVLSAASQSATTVQNGHIDSNLAVIAAQQALLDNLTPIQASIQGESAMQVANSAEVLVISSVPAPDPLHPGQTLIRPTLETRIHVPVNSGILAVVGLAPTIELTIDSSADIRVEGGAQT